jgi:hypothetical protein
LFLQRPLHLNQVGTQRLIGQCNQVQERMQTQYRKLVRQTNDPGQIRNREQTNDRPKATNQFREQEQNQNRIAQASQIRDREQNRDCTSQQSGYENRCENKEQTAVQTCSQDQNQYRIGQTDGGGCTNSGSECAPGQKDNSGQQNRSHTK